MNTGTTFTPELHDLREQCREVALTLRARALAVDADPGDHEPTLELLRGPSSTARILRSVSTPERFRTEELPDGAAVLTRRCLARVVANLELARGDAGVLQSIPGPSLAGLAVDALGDDTQQEEFYRVAAEPGTWTFFGMTEPDHGSDATAIGSTLTVDDDGGYRLNGAKRYVGNAARGTIGVVFARTGPSPLNLRATLLRRPADGFDGEALEMLGMRGARIGEMRFDDVHVPRASVLGHHLPASRRGIWGAGEAFNTMRLQLAAQAVGVATAVVDEVRALRPGWSGHEVVTAELAAARELVFDAAGILDEGRDRRQWPAVAKLHAVNLAVRLGAWAEAAVGPGGLLEHPLLEKWCRDLRAYEFMDGTTNVLRLATAAELARAA
ncbi:acyl-CoA dehydrogenase family protein [Pseudonocardia endophytica]|uniref:Alkylation response protein AidB-like acyl-CoA dehydrogenase n=1 Tax=Pseudonocardia endophytica TaxID=401976 RepID=A0A4R1HK98_PSEEN|nr:acyl-CoA dehydrogenase [Pseudonocardia endophytica]TCK22298.1 alkylation response protein AidB-like acyl-CoA dehydrogenase [Pseudonocardia endophytica]